MIPKRPRCSTFSRREFLGTMAAAAWGASALGARQPASPFQHGGRRPVLREDRFGRMFPEMAPFAEPSPALEEALIEIGRPGGMMDANDPLHEGPVKLITELSLSSGNPNNDSHNAGVTFVGQFMDHDMTFDVASRLGEPADPADSPNGRTPAFDLDSVYGGGPIADPDLYERAGHGKGGYPVKLKVQSGGLFEDLPRDDDGIAIIADPRNDENLVIAGLQAAFLLFHNRAVDLVQSQHRHLHRAELFARARRLTTWHYHWILVHEILPAFIGQDRCDEILHGGRRYYRPNVAYIPVEFQGAAYRFGHSMVRPSYRANLAGDEGGPFFGMIFDPTQEGVSDPGDLRGGARARRRFIAWQTFFDFGDGEMKPNKLIDTKLSTPLFHLPLGAIPGQSGPTSLPQRNLLRHVTWGLPSGQSIAREMRVAALNPDDLPELRGFGLGLETSTPLWYYLLKEAELMEGGRRLGPVGSGIVGEVILGLLTLDRQGYLSRNTRWKPSFPDRSGNVTGEFRVSDFLAFAGVDPLTRGQ